ncbi:phage tail protein [Mesorhizobium sp. M0016]|uniref:TipJ family phage tail tip protein n=1 Tax=Mesorhizobium sp. M0016 TaxID=2956843 RepID=UPI00333C4D49
MSRPLSGSAGGSKPKRTPDNLFSTDSVEVVLGLSEGPIEGLVDGGKTFLIGETPLQNVDGENNFDSFELIIREGSEIGEEIVSRSGGFGSSTDVSTELTTNVPVIRQGLHTNIDYIDFRVVINHLEKVTDKGSFNNTGKVKFEYRATGASSWIPVSTLAPPSSIIGDGFAAFFGILNKVTSKASPGDRTTFWTSSTPITTEDSGIWFNSGSLNHPKTWNGTAWVEFGGIASATVGAYLVYTWSEKSSWGADKATKAYTGGLLPPTGVEQGDYWLNDSDSIVYFFNGSTWIVAGSSLAPGSFGGSDNDTVVNGELLITGKTTSPFVKEFRFAVPRSETDTYQLRVTKTSPANTTQKFFDVTWESFQEITAAPFKFPGLATAQLTARASDQFSSIPDFSGIYRGRIIRIPSNYNPTTRVYTGVWDGTWVLSYSNNPALVANDLVLNDRYGMNAYYPVVLNKYDVYEAAQWCDTRNANGNPRFTFNGQITDPTNGREMIDYICGIFGGRFFDDGNGSAVIRLDKDTNAVAIFAPENVEGGIFTYSFTEISTRFNDITVTFVNPDLNYKEDRRRVFDQTHIDRYGRIPSNFIAVGCRSAEEAITRGRYKLITGVSETMMVNFKTNRMAQFMNPYDIVLISDDDMDAGLSGRVKEFASAIHITLRDAVYLEPGFNYKIVFQSINETTGLYQVEEHNIIPGTSGAVSDLTLTAPITADLPDNAVFAIRTTDDTAAPMAFRVVSIAEVEGDPDAVEVSAIYVNRLKWLYVDGIIEDYENAQNYDVRANVKPNPVPNLRVSATTSMQGAVPIYNILLDWDNSPNNLVTRYQVFVSKDNGPFGLLGETSSSAYQWDNVPLGEYVFNVVAITVSGRESDPAVIEHRLVGDWRSIPGGSGLRLQDEPFETVFESRSPKFAWDPATYPEHQDYRIRIINDSSFVLYETFTTELFFVYEQTLNTTLNSGTPARSFTIEVTSRDQYGTIAGAQQLSVSNTAPAAPSHLIADPSADQVIIQFEQPTIRDYAGVLVYKSTVPDFTPAPGDLVYQGANSNISIQCDRGHTYYFRVAIYDFFGTQGLNFAPQLSVVVPTEAQEISATVVSMLAGISGQVSSLFDYVEMVAGNSAIHNASSEIVRQDITQSVANAFATIAKESEVRANAIQAVANDVTVLQTHVTDLETLSTGQASAISSLQTQVSAKPAVFLQAAAPATTGPTGSIWIDSDDNNKIYILQAGAWVDASVAGMTVFFQASPPTTTVLGALWYDSDDNKRMYRWNGTVWQDVSDSRVSALATAMTAVEAGVDDATASGLFKIETSAGSGSVLARQTMYVRASLSDTFKQAGLVIEVYTFSPGVLKTRIVLNADQIVMTDGTTTTNPFIYEGGVLKLVTAKIGTAIIDKFQTTSGKTQIGTFTGGAEGVRIFT